MTQTPILQVLDLIHHIDVVEALISEGVSSSDNWAWVKQLRYYRTGRTGATALAVKMADATLDYSWEYQGNAPKLVYTPLTDRCYLTLTQVARLTCLSLHHHGLFHCWSWARAAHLQVLNAKPAVQLFGAAAWLGNTSPVQSEPRRHSHLQSTSHHIFLCTPYHLIRDLPIDNSAKCKLSLPHHHSACLECRALL